MQEALTTFISPVSSKLTFGKLNLVLNENIDRERDRGSERETERKREKGKERERERGGAPHSVCSALARYIFSEMFHFQPLYIEVELQLEIHLSYIGCFTNNCLI